MEVAVFFALMGGIILIGFLANLLFKLTKIPSVLLLMGIGLILGPVTGWITSDLLIKTAPYFGTMALIIILFEGGLELDIITVVRQAPRATLLATAIFIVSVALVGAFGFYVMELSLINSIMLASILGATSPAICIPVVSGLSVREEVKTILKLESALGDVFLIVSVLLLIEMNQTGVQSAGTVIMSFATSFAVAFVIASVAGALWSRLMGWLGKEPLSSMLTLGFLFLLYFVVEELHGSAAIAVLLFGLMLENMQLIAGRVGIRLRRFFGFNIADEKFALNHFIKNITAELSFVFRTFFFVYLGLLLNFDDLSWESGLFILGMSALIIGGRWLVLQPVKKAMKSLSQGEYQVFMAMLPRGLATAVMALLPLQFGFEGIGLFPMYAFGVIVLTNIFMTGGVLFAERRLKSETTEAAGKDAGPEPADLSEHEAAFLAQRVSEVRQETAPDGETAPDDRTTLEDELKPGRTDTGRRDEDLLFSLDDGFGDEPPPKSFTGWMARMFGIHSGDLERGYLESYKAVRITDSLFWVQVFLAAAITTLGLILNESAIIFGAALIMPIMFPVLAGGLALSAGDIYLLIKLAFKMTLVVLLTVLLSAVLADILPFTEVTTEISARIRPSVISFLVAFFAGMAGAALLSRKNRFVQFLPGAIIAITLLPPLCVVGFGISHGVSTEIVQGASLLFVSNFFANSLGAMIVFTFIGMPRAASLESVQAQKQAELTDPLASAIFRKLRLRRIVGQTGSVRARIIGTGLFLLVLFIPLQDTLNKLGTELRARQSITDIEDMFDVPYRSSIINTSSNIEQEQIHVRIQVATNSFFTSADIDRFEQRLSDRTGTPVRLDLIQSLSDIGEDHTVQDLLRPSATTVRESEQSVASLVSDLRLNVQNTVRSVPLPSEIDLVSLSTELMPDTLGPTITIVYLAGNAFSNDATDLLSAVIAGRLSLPRESIRYEWVPSFHAFEVGKRREFSDADLLRLRNINGMLRRHERITATVSYPEKRYRQYHPDEIKTELTALLGPSLDSGRLIFWNTVAPPDSVYIDLHVIRYLETDITTVAPDTLGRP